VVRAPRPTSGIDVRRTASPAVPQALADMHAAKCPKHIDAVSTGSIRRSLRRLRCVRDAFAGAFVDASESPIAPHADAIGDCAGLLATRNSCALWRNRACAAPESCGRQDAGGQSSYTFAAMRTRRRGSVERAHRERRGNPCVAIKQLDLCAFAKAQVARRPRPHGFASLRCVAIAAGGKVGGYRRRQKSCAGELTVEKTVIRFRSNRRCRRRE
jgi:hypothetical protein